MKSHYFKNYKNRWLLTLKVHNLNSCQKQSWDCWEVSAGLSQMSQLRVPYNEFREQNQAWNIILQKVSSISQNLSSLWLFLTRIGSTFGSIDLVPWEHGLHLQSLIKVSQSRYNQCLRALVFAFCNSTASIFMTAESTEPHCTKILFVTLILRT